MSGSRPGYTTGSCAAAAAKAAAILLAGDRAAGSVEIPLPGGRRISLPLVYVRATADGAEAAVRKDAGDDPDVTNGALITAAVSWTGGDEVEYAAGDGVGTVTKPGLTIPAGEPAINPAPRRMTAKAARGATPRGVGHPDAGIRPRPYRRAGGAGAFPGRGRPGVGGWKRVGLRPRRGRPASLRGAPRGRPSGEIGQARGGRLGHPLRQIGKRAARCGGIARKSHRTAGGGAPHGRGALRGPPRGGEEVAGERPGKDRKRGRRNTHRRAVRRRRGPDRSRRPPPLGGGGVSHM